MKNTIHGNWLKQKILHLSAKYIHRHKSKHTAAIASKLAAELYDLEIIAPDIHTLKNNYTRFLMVQRKEDAIEVEDADKASVYFETDHSKGSLAKVLINNCSERN